jgi:hypothetical protein
MFGKGTKFKASTGMSVASTVVAAQLFITAPAVADEFQRIYRSPAYLGRGDTGVADTDGAEAIFYNPAGLAAGKGIFKEVVLTSPGVSVSSDTRALIKDVASSDGGGDTISTLTRHVGSNQHIAFSNLTAIVLRRAAIGVLGSAETNVLVYKDPAQGGLEAVDANLYSTAGATFSLADSFYNGGLLIGGTIGWYQRAQAELQLGLLEAQNMDSSEDIFGYGTTSPVTLGAMLVSSGKTPSTFGLTVHNLGDAHVSPNSQGMQVDNLKQRIDAGYSVQTSSKAATAKFLVDVVDVTSRYTSDIYKKLHVGGEITLVNRLGLSAGLNQGGPCAGMFLDLWLARIDAGFYTEEVGEKVGLRSDMRYFGRIKVGF